MKQEIFGSLLMVPFIITLIFLMCSGVVPQQPPIVFAPASMSAGMKLAVTSGDSLKTVFPSTYSGTPAFACIKIGIKKFAYDIWGDTVNLASRAESHGIESQLNITENTYNRVKEIFECEHRGEIEVKNLCRVNMYIVKGYKV